MGNRVNVVGVGMVKFAKPGASEDYNVIVTAREREGIPVAFSTSSYVISVGQTPTQ